MFPRECISINSGSFPSCSHDAELARTRSGPSVQTASHPQDLSTLRKRTPCRANTICSCMPSGGVRGSLLTENDYSDVVKVKVNHRRWLSRWLVKNIFSHDLRRLFVHVQYCDVVLRLM